MAWGKIIGGVLGAAMGGPIGAGIGIAVGAGFDRSEDNNTYAEAGINQSSFFKAVQIGDAIRITSRQLLPVEASRVGVMIQHRGQYVTTPYEVFADDEQDFQSVQRVINRGIAMEIPLGVLALDRDTPLPLTLEIAVFSEEEPIGVDGALITVAIRRRPWHFMQWIEPIVDVYVHYALRSGPWSSDKIRLIKSMFEDLVENDLEEAALLRDRLKLAVRPSLDQCIESLKLRFNEHDLAKTVLLGVGHLLRLSAPPDVCVRRDIALLGERLLIHPQRINSILEEFPIPDEFSLPPDEPDDTHWACGALGVAPGASRDVVQAAWRKKISELHPDKYANLPASVQDLIKSKAQEINRARDVLLGS